MTKADNNTKTKSRQARTRQLLERIDKTLLAIQLEIPTCKQVNTVIEQLTSIDDAIAQLVESQESLVAAAEALAEAMERLRSLTLADSTRVDGNGIKPPQDKLGQRSRQKASDERGFRPW